MHYTVSVDGPQLEQPDQGPYLPIWQSSPYLTPELPNNNQLRTHELAQRVLDNAFASFGTFITIPAGTLDSRDPRTSYYSTLQSVQERKEVPFQGDPMAVLYIPVFDSFDRARRKVVGVLTSLIHWSVYFRKILPESARGIVVVLHSNECADGTFDAEEAEELARDQGRDLLTTIVISEVAQQNDDSTGEEGSDNGHEIVEAMDDDLSDFDPDMESEQVNPGKNGHEGAIEESHQNVDKKGAQFTYVLDGSEVKPLGFGDLHDPKFDKWGRKATFGQVSLPDGTAMGITLDHKCSYHIHVYPSQEFFDEYQTSTPFTITATMVSVFAIAILLFLLYDCLVGRRQKLVLRKATQSTAIMSSLFPKNVRDRLMEDENTSRKQNRAATTKGRIKGFLAGDRDCPENDDPSLATIADLFPHCKAAVSTLVYCTSCCFLKIWVP